MDWIRENKVPAALIGVSAVGALALGALVFNAYSSYSSSLDQFDLLNTRVASMKSAPLAPTAQNLQAKTALIKDYSTSVDTLSLVLHKLQQPAPPTSTTEFQAKLKTKIADIRKLAADNRVSLPPDFNLAFDRYNASLPKSNEVATQLANYLDAVYELIQLCISSGVRSVDVVDRTELPSEKDAPAAPKAAPAKSKAPAKKGAAAQRVAAPAAPSVMEKTQVRLVLTLDQGPLQKLIERLASPTETPNMPYFPIVRVLRVENERQEGPPVQAGSALPGDESSGAAASPAPAPTATTGEAPAARDAVQLLGNEMLKVFLEIDFVKFL